MDYDAFLTIVEQAAHIDREAAEQATRATRLPPELAPYVATSGPAQSFDVDEFLGRVAQREGADVPTAERHARTGLDGAAARLAVDSVLETLGERLSAGEVDDLIARLPPELHAPLRDGRDRNGNLARMTLEGSSELPNEYERVLVR